MKDSELDIPTLRMNEIEPGLFGKIVEVSVRGRLVAWGESRSDGDRSATVKIAVVDQDGKMSELQALKPET